MSALSLITRGMVCITETVTVTKTIVTPGPTVEVPVPLPPLPPPLPSAFARILGIHQSDIIIRTALEYALDDVRAHPEYLDACFGSLRDDPLTSRTYGVKEIDAVKQWFVKTKIPVLMTPVIDESQCPCISIALVGSDENVSEATLADVNGEASSEEDDSQWAFLAQNLKVASYNRTTGVVTLRSVPSTFTLAAGQYLIDKNGGSHEILSVVSGKAVEIEAGTVADFGSIGIKQKRPTRAVDLESSSFRETYRIGVHVAAEPHFLIWLHTVVVFCLLKYKAALLEARGFERTTFGSTDFSRDMQFDPQFAYSRYINISGHVRQYWPATIHTRKDAISVEDPGLQIISNKDGNPHEPDEMWHTIDDIDDE